MSVHKHRLVHERLIRHCPLDRYDDVLAYAREPQRFEFLAKKIAKLLPHGDALCVLELMEHGADT